MENLLRYGIDNKLAEYLISVGLTVSTIRNTSQKNLVEKYNLSIEQAKYVKSSVKREPIDENLLETLLERSAYTCNICKGIKSDAYIIHHIDPYNETQNNDYNNLIVLCPNDHELAHRKGEGLANKITKKQLILAKRKWEKRVEEQKVRAASLQGDIRDIDYINVNRVLELAIQVNKKIPETEYTHLLKNDNLITNTGNINPELYEKYNLNKNTPLKFFAMYGSTMLIMHYYDILIKTFNKLKVYDLDDLLKLSELKKGILGKYCYYVGGVYGRQYKGEITKNSKPTLLHFRRKPFKVEWKIDPMYITSSTASWRISSRQIFLIYGKILNVQESKENDEKYIKIEIRPYAYGLPTTFKDRTPDIHYIKNNYDDYFDLEEE